MAYAQTPRGFIVAIVARHRPGYEEGAPCSIVKLGVLGSRICVVVSILFSEAVSVWGSFVFDHQSFYCWHYLCLSLTRPCYSEVVRLAVKMSCELSLGCLACRVAGCHLPKDERKFPTACGLPALSFVPVCSSWLVRAVVLCFYKCSLFGVCMSFSTLLFECELPYYESEPCGEILRVCGESPPSATANASVPRT